MSAFSDVDAAADPRRLIRSLEESSRGLAAMKAYLGETLAALALGGGPVLDLGCGAGHDLVVLERLGVDAIGVDPSTVMVSAARTRTSAPLVRAAGARLPYRDGTFGGCWIERVLMHVEDPRGVLAEVVRCLGPGAVLAVFEPDWSSLTVCGEADATSWSTMARNPAIGAEVGTLLEGLGCAVRDRVEERSWWTFGQLQVLTARPAFRSRAPGGYDAWMERLRARDAAGTFEAQLVKVAWIATTPTEARR